MFRGRGLIELEQCSKQGFPSGSDGKESTTMQEIQVGSPALGRSPGEGNGNPLQYSCLENPISYGLWGCKESDMTEQLTSTNYHQGHSKQSVVARRESAILRRHT